MATEVKRIVVGVDGSDNSARAQGWAIALASALDAEVVAVHAVGLLAHLDSGPPVPAQAHLEELRRIFAEEWCAPLASSGIKYKGLCVDGAPVVVLVETARSEQADLVVVGRRGAGGHPELLLGSTSHQLVETCGCPVLIIPPAGERSDVSPDRL